MVKPKKILVIDDDMATCTMIEQTLGNRGYNVRISPDARSGYETARSFVPDLIFINLLLPDTNGLKLSKAVHALDFLRHVPVIMFVSSYGELDTRYTVTIGIVDTLVKPLKEEDVIAKTATVLGYDAGTVEPEETIRKIAAEEIQPVMLLREEKISEEEPIFRTAEAFDVFQAEDRRNEIGEGRESFAESIKEEEADMSHNEIPADKKKSEFDDKDLFSDEADIFGEELDKSMEEVRQKPLQSLTEGADAADDGIDLTYEKKSSSPAGRIIVIVAAIVIGLAIGVGGYLFFAAGNKQTPVQKQVVRVLPEPSAVPTAPPADKPTQIPEIPVKQEVQKTDPAKPEPAPIKDAKTQEPVKPEQRKEAIQKSEPAQPKKELAPATVQPEGKKPDADRTATKKGSPSASMATQLFTVQAGLFAHEANATALAEKIKEKGYTPSVASIETPEKKTLYRVTIGTYASRKKAAEVSEALKKQGIQTIIRKQ